MTVQLACPATERLCRSAVTVFSVPDRRSRSRALRKELRLGRLTVTIVGGRTGTLPIAFTNPARRALRAAARRGVVAQAYAVVRDDAGNVGTASTAARLRLARRR